MSSRRWRTRTGLLLTGALALSTPAGVPALAGAAATGSTPTPTSVTSGTSGVAATGAATGDPQGPHTTVTLLTGDRVVLGPEQAGQRQVQVLPAERPGRHVSFRTWQSGQDVYVVPSDVDRLVPRLLDLSLFDVSAQARAGLDDTRSTTLPLLVQHRQDARPDVVSRGGPLRPTRELTSIDATAATLDKGQTGALGDTLATAQRTALTDARHASTDSPQVSSGPLAGVTRIWLDQPFHATSLDRNLTQIGAPAAWRQGRSGAGVRVAVLDTGVDATHPDLAGQVTEQANFTPSPDAADRIGHGTHVASIIAGTGAAADGERRGVAFGADVLNGKVLDDGGTGDASWIIAGMEWAVAQHAAVVNMSVGTFFATDGSDPVSQAVERLSRESNTLFVVAAGNAGPDQRSVGSPGAADAALTVGAVDGNDALATFSSRGPRLGDHGLKPEITAPGVAITAARAAGTTLDTPVDDNYVRASGTSMATPHVAGAAALLAEEHPDWDGDRIKSALVGSSRQISGQSVYEQGAGRLDLDRALSQVVVADRSTVDFTTVDAGTTAPVTRSVTVTNTGTRPTTADLALTLRTEDGRPAPARLARLSTTRLSLPAGGSDTVTVTLDPTTVGTAATGAYTGELAVSPGRGGHQLRLPVGAYFAPPTVNVRVKVLDRLGQPLPFGSVHLVNAEDVLRSPVEMISAPGLLSLNSAGEATAAVPVGTYSLFGLVDTFDDQFAFRGTTFVGTAETRIDRDTTLVLDSRTVTTAPTVSVEGLTEQKYEEIAVGYHRSDPSGHSLFFEFNIDGFFVQDGLVFVQPTQPVRVGSIEAREFLRVSGRDARGPAEVSLPYVGGSFPAQAERRVSAAELARFARVDTSYRALDDQPREYRVSQVWFTPHRQSSINRAALVDFPVTRTEYFMPTPEVTWSQCVIVVVPHGPPIDQHCDRDFNQVRTAGTHDTKRWLDGPFDPDMWASRKGDALSLQVNPLVDGDDRVQQVFFLGVRQQSARVWRDGILLKDGPPPGQIGVPTDRPSWITVERGLELDPQQLPLPSSTSAKWTFVTRPGDGSKPATPPVLLADVRATVDDHSMAAAGLPLTLDLDAHHLPGAPSAAVTQATMSVTADDGATWTTLTLRRTGSGTYRAVVPASLVLPGGAVGIRVSARDALGDTVEQTSLRAVRVR